MKDMYGIEEDSAFLVTVPVMICAWDTVLEEPTNWVLEEGWDLLNNEQRKLLLDEAEETIEEMRGFIVPDFLPEAP